MKDKETKRKTDDKKIRREQQFFGEGSFGCVLRPPPKCVKNETHILKNGAKNDVAKIFIDKDEFQVEKAAAQKLAQADSTGKSILLPSIACETSYKNVAKIPISDKCTELHKLKDIYGEPDSLYMLRLPYGGITLEQYVHSRTLTVKDYMRVTLPIFEAILKVQSIGYCHQDVKNTNILVRIDGEMKDKAWLIDYSLIERIKNIYTHDNRRRLRHSYFPYPPEYKLYAYIEDIPTDERVKEDCKPYEKMLENVLHFGSHRTKTYFEYHERIETHRIILDVYRMMDKLYKEGKGKFKDFMTKNAATKVDLYSIGMVIIDNDYVLSREGMSEKYLKKYRHFVQRLTHPDFRKRYTSIGAYRAAKALAK